jgi:hypothetical protein
MVASASNMPRTQPSIGDEDPDFAEEHDSASHPGEMAGGENDDDRAEEVAVPADDLTTGILGDEGRHAPARPKRMKPTRAVIARTDRPSGLPSRAVRSAGG